MMVFIESQRACLESRARTLLITLKAAMGDKDDYIVGHIMREQEECCSMGYSIAMHEVQSTPWEYRRSEISEAVMNGLSDEGWEPIMTHGDNNRWMIWRRRKVVGDGDSPATD